MPVLTALKPFLADSGDCKTRLTGVELWLYCDERNSMSISCVSLKYCERHQHELAMPTQPTSPPHDADWNGSHGQNRTEQNKTNPEKSTAGAIGSGEFHACTKTSIVYIASRCGYFGDGNHAVARDPSTHDQLQARIATQLPIALPVFPAVQRIRNQIGGGCSFAVGTAGDGGVDGVRLRFPISVGGDVVFM